jgi:hypothetical protein
MTVVVVAAVVVGVMRLPRGVSPGKIVQGVTVAGIMRMKTGMALARWMMTTKRWYLKSHSFLRI